MRSDTYPQADIKSHYQRESKKFDRQNEEYAMQFMKTVMEMPRYDLNVVNVCRRTGITMTFEIIEILKQYLVFHPTGNLTIKEPTHE